MKRKIFEESFYKEAANQLMASKAMIQNAVNSNKYNKEYLLNLCNEEIEKVKTSFLIGFVQLTDQLDQRQDAIKRAYQSKTSYFDNEIKITPLPDNPSLLEREAHKEQVERARIQQLDKATVTQANSLAEMLKRQDFDLKLKVMENYEVANYIEEVIKAESEVSPYEFNMLRLRAKDLDETYSVTVNKLAELVNVEKIGREWEKDEEYLENAEKLREIATLPKEAIFIHEPQTDDPEWRKLYFIEDTIYDASQIPDNQIKKAKEIKANKANKETEKVKDKKKEV